MADYGIYLEPLTLLIKLEMFLCVISNCIAYIKNKFLFILKLEIMRSLTRDMQYITKNSVMHPKGI